MNLVKAPIPLVGFSPGSFSRGNRRSVEKTNKDKIHDKHMGRAMR